MAKAKKKKAKKRQSAATRARVAKKTARNTAASLPGGGDVPDGFKQLDGSYADSWDVEAQPILRGIITGKVKSVVLTIDGEKKSVRCCQLTENETEERVTIWESANLEAFMDQIARDGTGREFFLRYDGLGEAKAGQNAVKLFTVAFLE